jgi:CRP/FNR family transcriptional regulator
MAAAAHANNELRTIPAYARPARAVIHDIGRSPIRCSTCNLHALCMPVEADLETLAQIDTMVGTRMRVRKGASVFRAGERFSTLYAIRAGSCKTVMVTEDGHDQVSGYYMQGEVMGIEGIGAGTHDCQAIALEDSELCALPFERVEELARTSRVFQHGLHRMLSREIARERSLMLVLGSMRAEQRLAYFLLDLSRRYKERGYSSTEFVLRMTREEIGSHLGLTLETVSRLFSRLQQEGFVQVQGRTVKLLDRMALTQLVEASVD